MLLLKRCASLQSTKLDEHRQNPGDLYLYLTGGWRLIFFCFASLFLKAPQLYSSGHWQGQQHLLTEERLRHATLGTPSWGTEEACPRGPRDVGPCVRGVSPLC